MPNVIIINQDYYDAISLKNVTNYVKRLGIFGGYALDPSHAFDQMILVKRKFHKTNGIQLKHFLISFSNSEMYRLDFDDLLNIGFQTGVLFAEYQMVYGVHYDTAHFHLHVAMNTVSFVDGHKYSDGLAVFWKLKSWLQQMFPKSLVNVYYSIPNTVNEFSFTGEDYLTQIG